MLNEIITNLEGLTQKWNAIIQIAQFFISRQERKNNEQRNWLEKEPKISNSRMFAKVCRALRKDLDVSNVMIFEGTILEFSYDKKLFLRPRPKPSSRSENQQNGGGRRAN